MSVKLNKNNGVFYVPYSDYIEENKPLWYVGFSKFEIEIIDETHYHFGYDEDSYSGWGDIYADLCIKKGKYIIKGKGSKNFRESIINAYDWFIKAKNDERYIELFHHLWFDK